MPATASALRALLDAGHDPADVIERAQPAFGRAEAAGDERAEAELFGLVELAWTRAQHPADRAELTALRDSLRTRPGRMVARAAQTALDRRPDLPSHRRTPYEQLVRHGYLVGRIESWGGFARKRDPSSVPK